MSNLIIPLNPLNPLVDGKKHREGFYGKKEPGDKYWLGHKDGDTGDTHETRVSEEFFVAFTAESERLKKKYLEMLNKNPE